MLQTKLELHLNDNRVIEIATRKMLLNASYFVPSTETNSLGMPLLLVKNHGQLNSTLPIDSFDAGVILKFDVQKTLTGVAFNLKQSSGTFTIVGTESFFVFLALPIPEFLNNIASFTEK